MHIRANGVIVLALSARVLTHARVRAQIMRFRLLYICVTRSCQCTTSACPTIKIRKCLASLFDKSSLKVCWYLHHVNKLWTTFVYCSVFLTSVLPITSEVP